MKTRFLAGLALASLIWTGCNENMPLVNDPCVAFKTTLAVQDRFLQQANTFNVGEEIRFKMEIANITNASATLTAGSPCTAVIFEVFDSAKQRRWGSADNIACIQALQPRTYQPHESVEYTDSWGPGLQGNPPAQPGTFTVVANVGQYMTDSQGRQLECRAALSKSATFSIQ